ncbi:DNA-binding MarR family transcriptional regulator [Mycetocola sp. BIGb0189]|uniref:MarR family winged helix-turn-helix transcriptional regulator n=1 Tax=Mycetocola sp. BIGb0189 TaxID=2940604 RepID=UPI002168D165|nr:MarR family transcriptional regulator [Mycetocola sp. BIGb0189]MCS4275042.1 DNA-binding MarR family transcriptional regulator [Mycetocola sp. BIGb0189]
MDTPRWLNDEEIALWKRLQAISEILPATVDAQLRADVELTRYEYYVLAMLSEAPERKLPMSTLALVTNGSLSRLSHAARRLEQEGWIVRERVPTDRRAMIATLTDAGFAKIVDAAPGHVERVRQVLFDHLSTDQVAALNAALAPVLTALLPELGDPAECPGGA